MLNALPVAAKPVRTVGRNWRQTSHLLSRTSHVARRTRLFVAQTRPRSWTNYLPIILQSIGSPLSYYDPRATHLYTDALSLPDMCSSLLLHLHLQPIVILNQTLPIGCPTLQLQCRTHAGPILTGFLDPIALSSRNQTCIFRLACESPVKYINSCGAMPRQLSRYEHDRYKLSSSCICKW